MRMSRTRNIRIRLTHVTNFSALNETITQLLLKLIIKLYTVLCMFCSICVRPFVVGTTM